jgi:hypothetical protein
MNKTYRIENSFMYMDKLKTLYNHRAVTISFGKIAYGSTKKVNEVTINIELRKIEGKGPELSIRGSIWNTTHTDCNSCGQNLDEIAKYIKPYNSRYIEFQQIYRWWHLYHLNGMNAGTVEQDMELQKFPNVKTYVEQCEILKKAGLYEVKLPDGTMYKYGSAWLYREIPDKDLREIIEYLFSQITK